MSLTKDEWVEMWKTVKYIEGVARAQCKPIIRDLILMETKKIKRDIQKVIGQME
jgi:hypothetical protein